MGVNGIVLLGTVALMDENAVCETCSVLYTTHHLEEVLHIVNFGAISHIG